MSFASVLGSVPIFSHLILLLLYVFIPVLLGQLRKNLRILAFSLFLWPVYP